MLNLLKYPDFISMLNGFFGLSAILILVFDFSLPIDLKFHLALTLILLGLLADGLDGIIARRYGKGELGDYFEAMSDMTTMGIAPSVFLAIRIQSEPTHSLVLFVVFWLILILYLCCAFIRLASFHPLKNKHVFLGLPASAATIFVLSISFLTQQPLILITSIVLAAVFMVLPISFPKPSNMMNAITVIIIVLTMLFGVFFFFMYGLLLFSVLMYMFGGHVYLIFSRKSVQTLKKK
jgi:archaetidylserine synthase